MNIKELCKEVPPEYRAEVVTLAKSVKALKKKIEDQLPTYNSLPLAQLLTTTQGEKALKSNPAAQEFRATVRDYAQALEKLTSIIEENRKRPRSDTHSLVGNSRWTKPAAERQPERCSAIK